MIDLDYMPAAVAVTITIAFVGPFFYSFFIDNYDKRSPQIRTGKD